MSRAGAFKVEGAVIAVLPNQTCCIELANGHRLTGFVTGKDRSRVGQLTAGARVRLELSPYDLSEGRIILETQK
jgi:translation initiation factor IF-1